MAENRTETEQDEAWQTLEAIDRASQSRSFWLVFPAALEAQFEKDTAPHRRHRLAMLSALAVVLFNLFGLVDHISVPDIITEAMLIRHGVFTAVGLALAYGIHRAESAHRREMLAVLGGLGGGAVLLALVTLSDSPLRADYVYGIVPILMFVVLVKRVRFPYALAVSAGLLLLHGLMMAEVAHLVAIPAATTGLIGTIVLLTLLAGHNIEREHRRNYLGTLRERLHRRTFEALSLIDPLTGLGNRRALDLHLAELERAGGTGEVALIFGDIDYFKPYNDSFGHVAGDECLRRVGRLLLSEARGPDDLIFRYGGEEFVAVLPGLAEDSAMMVAERMRRAVHRARIPHCHPKKNSVVTVSFGVAAARLATDSDPRSLIKRADGALYRAKLDGRNCVRTATQAKKAADEGRKPGALAG